MTTHRALGRGLSALIPETPTVTSTESTVKESQITQVRLDAIRANPYQPRSDFNQEKLQELIHSVRERGIIQPVVVRPSNNGYELVAGERRLRAAQALGWTAIPAIVRQATNRDTLELSLLENIQRDDLNPIEQAKAYERLSTEFGLTQEAMAKATGKQRSSIANTLRLLKLPEQIIAAIRTGAITAGHAKALLAIEDAEEQIALFERMLTEETSVREAEDLTHRARRQGARRPRTGDPELRALEERLQHRLGTKVQILHAKKRGKIQIEYYSNDDLQRLVDLLAARGSA